MNDEQAKRETGGNTADSQSAPPPATARETNAHNALSTVHASSSENHNPSQPLRRTPSFWQAVFAGCLVVNAAVTSCLLFKQHEVTRQQLVGTQAAIVTLGVSIYPNNALSVLFDHRGVVAARDVRFVFHAVRKTIPDFADIATPISHTVYMATFGQNSFPPGGEYSLPGFTPSVLEAIRRTEQTVMVTGEFTYDNGFGDVQREKVCMYWLSGIPNKAEAEGGANSFYPCDDFYIRMSNVLKAKKEFKVP
jgi:hypothetical protein